MAVRTADNDHGRRERLIDDRVLRPARNRLCPYSDVGVVLLVPCQDLSDGGAFLLIRRCLSQREGMQGNHTAPAELRLGEREVECPVAGVSPSSATTTDRLSTAVRRHAPGMTTTGQSAWAATGEATGPVSS